MKFGLFLSNQHLAAEDMRKRFRDHLQQVREARRLGFQSIWAGQHFLSSPYLMFQPTPVLARMVAEAEGLTVGNCVLLLSLLNPVDVAEQAATMDAITGGRYVLGVGLGYRPEEDLAFGVKSNKTERLVEAIQLIKALWRDKVVNFRGKFFQVMNSSTSLRPLRGVIPIWIAGNSDGAVRRAARLGDAWVMNPHATLTTLERQVKLYKEERAANGLVAEEIPILREAFVARTEKLAIDASRKFLENKYQSYREWGQDRALPREDRFQAKWEDLARERFIIGSPETCISEVESYRRRLGVTHMIIRTQWPGMAQSKVLQSMELIGRKVIPSFTERGSRRGYRGPPGYRR